MKVAIPLDENKQDVCPAFGRAPYFLIWEDGKQQILTNPAAASEGGAGLQAAQFIVDQGVKTLITPRCGQNAADVFRSADMEIYKSWGTGALDNIKALQDGKLEKLTHFHAGYHGLR